MPPRPSSPIRASTQPHQATRAPCLHPTPTPVCSVVRTTSTSTARGYGRALLVSHSFGRPPRCRSRASTPPVLHSTGKYFSNPSLATAKFDGVATSSPWLAAATSFPSPATATSTPSLVDTTAEGAVTSSDHSQKQWRHILAGAPVRRDFISPFAGRCKRQVVPLFPSLAVVPS
jgi:hypothetical protein